MRPIAGRETRVTMLAVKLSVKGSEELFAMLERGSGFTAEERQAARRVLRVRAARVAQGLPPNSDRRI